MRRIRKVRNNLSIICEINALSRAFSLGRITLEKVRAQLEELRIRPAPAGPRRHIVGGVRCRGLYPNVRGGGWREALIGGGVVGVMVLFIVAWLDEHPVPTVLQGAAGAAAAAAIVALLARLWGFNPPI